MSLFRGKGIRKSKTQTLVNYIVDDFLVENTITVIYGPPKQGKTMFLLGLTKWIYNNTNMFVEYFDFDNPLIAMQDRKADELWEELNDRFDYIHPEELEKNMRDEEALFVEAKEVLDELVKAADVREKNYKNTVMIFDSASDFCDETSDSSVKLFMSKLKRLRIAGATVIILHHTNKRDPNHKGSTIFKSASDCMYKLKNEYEDETGKTYILEKDDARFRVKDCAFKLSVEDFNIDILEYTEVCIPVHEQLDIRKVTVALRQNKVPMKQGELLDKALETTSANKNATAFLNKYEGKHWKSEPKGQSKIYSLI